MHQWGLPAPGLSPQAWKRIRSGDTTGSEEYARRCQATVYHIDYGVFDGVPFVVLVHPAKIYMHAAHGANRSTLSVSCLGAFPGLEADRGPRHNPQPSLELALAGQAAICAAVRILRWHGHWGPVTLTGHGQWTRKPADPGEWTYRHVVSPAVQAGVVEFSPGFSRGTGSPVDSGFLS